MNNNNLFTYIFKYIIVGDCCVGKSCLLANFLNKEFKTTHDVTIGVDFGVKMLELQDKNIIKLFYDFKNTNLLLYRKTTTNIDYIFDKTNKSFSNNGSGINNTVINILNFNEARITTRKDKLRSLM